MTDKTETTAPKSITGLGGQNQSVVMMRCTLNRLYERKRYAIKAGKNHDVLDEDIRSLSSSIKQKISAT